MRRTILSSLVVVAALALSSSAYAQTAPAYSAHGRGPGVGGVAMLNGASGALFTYGATSWHMDAMFGLGHVPGATDFDIGGRFWYHVHSAAFADFSLGGGLGLLRVVENDGRDHLDVALQVGGQIRAFIVPNVALLADLGVGAYFGDNDSLFIGGEGIGGYSFLQGTLGIAYFFE
jgi:hypothetical protein